MLLQQGGDGGQKPGCQAVGIDGDTDPDGGLWCGGSQLTSQFQLELVDLTIVCQQLLAELGRLQRLAADEQRLGKLLLQ